MYCILLKDGQYLFGFNPATGHSAIVADSAKAFGNGFGMGFIIIDY